MAEQHFQAPPVPPKAPSFGSVVNTPVSGDILPEKHFAMTLKLPVSIYKTQVMAGILGGVAVVGIILGAVLFGGSSASQRKPGLEGVIANPDWGGLRRCGSVSETSPCAVYYVNHSRNDKRAEDFFDTAAEQTGRAKYLINIENPHYAKTRIPPGFIAQIRIPPLR